METCFLSHVVLVRLSLTVLLVVLRPLNAWTYTSNSNNMDRTLVTKGYFSPSVTNSEEITALPKDVFTIPGTSTELLELSSPLTGSDIHHSVRHSDETDIPRLSKDKIATEQNMHTSTNSTNWTLEGTHGLSTEQMSSTFIMSTEPTIKWKDQSILLPEHLPEAYRGLPAVLRAVTQTKRSVDLGSQSGIEGRLSQDSTDTERSLREDWSNDQSTVGLREDPSSDRGNVGLRDYQSTDRGTVGLKEDRSTNRGTVGLREDRSTNRGTVGLSEDWSTSRGTVGLREDRSTNRGTVGLSEGRSTSRGTVGIRGDRSTNRGTVGIRGDRSTNRGTVGLRGDRSTNRGTVGLSEDWSTNRGTVGLREDQSTNRGTMSLREDRSTNRGTVGLREDQSTDRGTVGVREDHSTTRGTVGLREDQSTDRSTKGQDSSTDSSTVVLREDQSTDRGAVGLDSSTDLGTSTVSRAGERTILSVTFNSTSIYPEDSNSSSQSSIWGSPASHTGPRDITNRIPSTGLDNSDTTSDPHNPTNTTSLKGRQPSETQWPGAFSSRGTHPLTGTPNVTEQWDLTSLASEGTPSSTPPLSRYRDRDTTDSSQSPRGRTSLTEDAVSVSSQTPVMMSDDGPSRHGTDTSQGGDREATGPGTTDILVTGPGTTDILVTGPGTTDILVTGLGTTDTPTGPLSTQGDQGETEGVSSVHTEDITSLGPGLTTASPSLGDRATALDDSLSRFLSGQPPFIPKTERPAVATEVLVSTVPTTVTMTSRVTEAETNRVTTATITTPAPPTATTRMVQPSTTTIIEALTQPTSIPTSTTSYTTQGPQTSTSTNQHSGTPQTHTQGPSTWVTDITTLHLETSTAPPGNTTSHSGQAPTPATTASSYTQSATYKSTVAQPSLGTPTDRGTPGIQVTTTPTDIRSTQQMTDRACEPNPCRNGGGCATHGGAVFTCYCLPAWTGPTCNDDVNECESGPCPSDSTCVNFRGSFSCECPLGQDIENGRDCTRAKTFLGTFSVTNPSHDSVLSRSVSLHEIQREINQLLIASLSILRGYRRSTLGKKGEDGVNISAVNMFSITTDVTSSEVYHNIQMSLNNCTNTAGHCRVVVTHQLSYHVESLCLAQNTQCHPERSFCTDSNGTAYCQCQPGYFKLNPEDQSCTECGDGLKRVNGTCVRCTFGFGGFNCGNFYKLIAVVVSPAGGGLLLILIIALIVICCKKDKNDLNKIIFKSGDFQMSPYGEFPKSNRVSMEWGRETIEMQENGSTKNLLQMTDIYYSPALRNSDLERNGLYPFSGLPGSRHSCIYPAQWNPSFISDDFRRRDYF